MHLPRAEGLMLLAYEMVQDALGFDGDSAVRCASRDPLPYAGLTMCTALLGLYETSQDARIPP